MEEKNTAMKHSLMLHKLSIKFDKGLFIIYDSYGLATKHCTLIESYLSERQFRVIHKKQKMPEYHKIVYLVSTTDIPTTNYSMTAMLMMTQV